MKEKNVILEKSFDFALEIVELFKFLQSNSEYILSKQLLRSGTSIGENVEEAIAAQSRKDFVHKLSISAKEARESKYWLRLLQKSQLVKLDYTKHINNSDEILRILKSIIRTTSNS